MNKRQLRQSAADDFMQSLEHLDELLGETTETVILDETPQPPETDRAQTSSAKKSSPNPMAKNTPTKC